MSQYRSLFALALPFALLAFLSGCEPALPTANVSPPTEDGSELWLRYRPVSEASGVRSRATQLIVPGDSETMRVTRRELQRGLTGLLGGDVPIASAVSEDGAILVGTPSHSALIASLGLDAELARLGDEGFVIRSTQLGDHSVIAVASQGEVGALYGAYHLLRLVQTGAAMQELNVEETPRMKRRLLDHWDNLDGSVERGYAGASLWLWDELPERVDPRMEDYARANASLGLNGTVLNNVNANPQALSAEHLVKVARLADVFRPYGVRVYLSANFASPMVLGGLPTADPLDPAVAPWWADKAAEIYALIPDFGGFLVKANSEGQPGPMDYGRTHLDGANLLADALAPHGGVVMWRAFVYDPQVDPDRVKRAYLEFVPLDGKLRPNVFVQAKNGPLDFQPREPFHPLFGALPRTPLMAELQVTQEYLGHSNHLVYLAPMWKEFLDADTYASGEGSTVAEVIDGSLHGYADTGIAAVANTGRDANWTGHHFGQANWYAYGRLAWNPDLSAAEIADEWIRMTWGDDAEVIATIKSIMLDSREVYTRYTMPLGLHHLIGGDHYAPMPENPDPRRADWSAIYYHHADTEAIGFDRTSAGSGAVDQYHAPLNGLWGDPATCPDELLLWFHRLPWDFKMKSGRTLWIEIQAAYAFGAQQAAQLERRWESLEGKIDPARFKAVADKLHIQTTDAAAWRDKCVHYFQAQKDGTTMENPQ
jgi:alpha-glucuronidase